jgi:uncharacterized membrane protein SirB2
VRTRTPASCYFISAAPTVEATILLALRTVFTVSLKFTNRRKQMNTINIPTRLAFTLFCLLLTHVSIASDFSGGILFGSVALYFIPSFIFYIALSALALKTSARSKRAEIVFFLACACLSAVLSVAATRMGTPLPLYLSFDPDYSLETFRVISTGMTCFLLFAVCRYSVRLMSKRKQLAHRIFCTSALGIAVIEVVQALAFRRSL